MTELELASATLLEGPFVPQELAQRPGLYVAVAGTPAYALLYSMWPVGLAELAGERYDATGQKVVTMQVGKGQSRRQPNPAIGIGREFFVTALKDYEDWREKWWREAVQNAVDAGADEIALEARELPDKTFQVACQDNGGGMTEDVLLNKFLVLGGTTKTAAGGTAGGFGKAKELLVLPWISWSIHTQDSIAHGSGIQYEVTKAAEYLNGTRLEVVMPADQCTYDAPAISFLKKCWLPKTAFTVNGEKIKADLKPGKVIKELEGKAVAYFVPGDDEHSKMLVRATGAKFTGSIYMFEQWLGDAVKGYVIVELIGSSVDLLTANRDGFRDYGLRGAVQRLANEIAADVKSAVRSKAGMVRKKYTGTGKFSARERDRTEANLIAAAGSIPDAGSLPEENLEAVKMILEHEWQRPPEPGSEITASGMTPKLLDALLQLKFQGQTQLESALKQMVWTPDFYLINDREGFRIPKKFTPDGMTPTVLKLLKTWTELCRFVMIQLGCAKPFGVGFYFADDTGAACITEDQEQWLVLNPMPTSTHFSGEHQLNPEDNQDLNFLYELAIHEATHMADGIDYHNEAFASALTWNNAKCADGWRKIRKIADAIKLRKQEEYTRAPEAPEAEPEQEVDAVLQAVSDLRGHEHTIGAAVTAIMQARGDSEEAALWAIKRHIWDGKLHFKYGGTWQLRVDARAILDGASLSDVADSEVRLS